MGVSAVGRAAGGTALAEVREFGSSEVRKFAEVRGSSEVRKFGRQAKAARVSLAARGSQSGRAGGRLPNT